MFVFFEKNQVTCVGQPLLKPFPGSFSSLSEKHIVKKTQKQYALFVMNDFHYAQHELFISTCAVGNTCVHSLNKVN